MANRQEAHPLGSLAEKAFLKALCLERRRAERSRKSLLLALIRENHPNGQKKSERFLETILKAEPALSASIRETDIRGWYQEFSIYGIVFTEFNGAPREVIQGRVLEKIRAALEDSSRRGTLPSWQISFHFFPEDESGASQQSLADKNLYPDLTAREGAAKFSRSTKRLLDILGSLSGIVLLSPVFAAIAVTIKLNSRGPILFKQDRVGQYGARFTFLKFRSMSTRCDDSVHEDYVKRYISGREGTKQTTARGREAYKLVEDPRVTKVGRFLRKTSLDELPQLFNVLKGEMSLVGPRPPIPYELEAYDVWHMRRLLEARPGITGLWQVTGRSRTTFDEMVRLDLRYARTWSLWLDIKILLQTPGAVVSGNGAY
jgi:lipopolysaccharide/colanic/teichoic acid biosynthesis glycosyltransferase